jgi:hypothetical protein
MAELPHQRPQHELNKEVESPISAFPDMKSSDDTSSLHSPVQEPGEKLADAETGVQLQKPAGAPPGGPPPNGGTTAWLQVLGGFFLFFNTWVCAFLECCRMMMMLLLVDSHGIPCLPLRRESFNTLILTLLQGILNTFGVFQTYYESGDLFTETSSNISWIGSVQ